MRKTIDLTPADPADPTDPTDPTDPQEGIEDVITNGETAKILLDGQLYIIRNGQIYNSLGIKCK
ncbi:MAG: hypothetical protein J6T80_05440 [Paludibacteraceae bacterium]|nr:hypothetical protein [Paludibacteraceae bacterium]